MHARDKRKWFAVHFGNGYVKSPPLLTPSLAFGIGLPLLAILICSIAFLTHDSPGVALAITPLIACVDRANEIQKQIDQKMNDLEAIKKKASDENRLPTAEERAQISVITKEVRELAATRDTLQDEAEVRDVVNTSFRPPIRPTVESEDDLQKRFAEKGIVLPPKDKRFGAMGELIAAVIKADPRVDGRVDSRLVRTASGMGESSPADGGFMLQPDFSARLIEPLFDPLTGDGILNKLSSTTVTGNEFAINAIDETDRSSTNWGGIAVYWLGEGDAKTPTTPKLRRIELKLKKVAGLLYLTDELMADAPALSSRIERGFQIALRSAILKAIVRGTGAGQPLGLLSSSARITQTAETDQEAATIVTENVVNMYSRLDPNAVNPVWLYNRVCFPQLFKLQVAMGAAGALVNLPNGGIAVSPNQTLLGLPLIPVPWCSVLGTEGDLILTDLGQYEFISKGGAQVAYSIHLRFLYDETAMRIVFRCDGRPAAISATTLEDGSTTVSPIVTLATRS